MARSQIVIDAASMLVWLTKYANDLAGVSGYVVVAVSRSGEVAFCGSPNIEMEMVARVLGSAARGAEKHVTDKTARLDLVELTPDVKPGTVKH